MDVMDLRRGLLMGMTNAKPRMASGEFVHTLGVAYLNHNLNTNKILVIMQRVESDHANINSTNQFQSIMVFGATPEAFQLDTQQTYSLNGGNQAAFNDTIENVNGARPCGINSYFANETGTYPANGIMAYNGRGVEARDSNGASLNTVRICPTYGLGPGRWVWKAYALD